jgi:hypothetical protein
VGEADVDAFVRLAELDIEAVMLGPLDSDATLEVREVDEAALDGSENSLLLEAVDWAEDD